jgi:predicted N-formylglutamate amidohydrolase
MTGVPVILTCEHGGNEIPDRFRENFTGYEDLLKSHRGWDPGALDLTLFLAEKLAAPVWYSEISRLLVELNRSEKHRSHFSDITRSLPAAVKKEILDEFYYPFRKEVLRHISRLVQKRGSCIHFSVHSFAPEINGVVRKADIGLLYDPSRQSERDLAGQLAFHLKDAGAGLRIRMNYPYLGTADGHTTSLRKKFGAGEYIGIEIEVNQRLLSNVAGESDRIHAIIADAISSALSDTSLKLT